MMKAHVTDNEIKIYKNYRSDTVAIGDVLDIYEEAKVFMINRVTKTHGKDVSLWPKDVQQELRTSFAAADMFRDIMMALYKQRKDERAASADEHSPIAPIDCDYIPDEKILEEAAET
jgi:hypothetical protein